MRPRNPAFEHFSGYPFVRIEEEKSRRREQGGRLLDFSVGDPRERTPPWIRDRLARAIPERSGYPTAAGLPELRQAVAGWIDRRFGVRLDPDRHILPSNGAKEAIYLLHQALVDPAGDRRVVLIPDPAYPVYEVGTRFAGGIPERIPLDPARGFLPDLDRIDPETLRRTALLWLNYPNNPTGAVAGIDLYRRALDLARLHRFWVASDEAYSEIWFDRPPPSALQAGLDGLIVVHSLSKRSAMTGYRTGLIAGDPELIGLLRRIRPSQGVATPLFVQEAAIAAWGDEEHVAEQRELVRRKREILLPVLRRKGLEAAGSRATYYLWIRVPAGMDAESFFRLLLAEGIAVAPGTLFGPGGEGYVRMALVPETEECEVAAEILERCL